MMRKLSLWLLCVFCLLMSSALLFGQGATGASSVTGRITDTTGAVIGGAEVTLTDLSTSINQTTTSNATGTYVFTNVVSGKYDITVSKAGFRKSEMKAQEVSIGTVYTVNATLEVGAVSEVVEVKTVAGAELQTLNATMGSTITNEGLLELPSINRDAGGLLFVQPTTAPTFGGANSNIMGGQVAGNMSDQNTYLLDGGNNTSDLDGDNGTYVGSRTGTVPTPMESIEEFRVNTNNMTADFASSGGAQVMMQTKRGTNQFHGSAYDFFQSDVLSSNDWINNYDGVAKPKSHYNRFGGAFGGPVLPNFLGGKTYIYMNYEGERYPRSGPYNRVVPSDLFRQGIMQVRDASGNIVQYNLATSTACGPSGGQPCDPRGIGLNPLVSNLWNKYEPACNNFNIGDKLNTCGYLANLSYPQSSEFGVARVDHDFGSRVRFFSSYRLYNLDNPTTNQVDIGGLLPGDTKGVPAVASSFPVLPRYLVTGITATISPNLTNEFHMNYTRNFWQYLRAGAVPNVSGVPGAVEIGGETVNSLIPLNIETQDARQRLYNGHDYDWRDSLSWLKGNHLFQFGGDYLRQWYHFDRYDNVSGGLTQLKYVVGAIGNMPPSAQPIPCSTTVITNCLPASQLTNYNNLYGEMLGFVSQANLVETRTGASLALNPQGTPVASYALVNNYSLFINDSWKVKPNLTLSFGLNWTNQMPPYALNGTQDVLVGSNGIPISTSQYLGNRLTAAENGLVYNPVIGFSPVGAVGSGEKYPYQPFYAQFAPRAAIAWNPEVKGDGWLAKILGDKSTVIRAGYGRFYTKNLSIDQLSSTVLGDGFLNPVTCSGGSITGQCLGPNGVTPATAFRIGVDGNTAPFPSVPQTLPSPVIPCISGGCGGLGNAAYENLSIFMDNKFRPGSSDQIDFTIQRQLKGNMIAEVGYVGIWARNLFQGVDLNSVPIQMKLGGQTFAQAYLAMAQILNANPKAVPPPQPFFEQALKGTSYCKGYSTCTAAVAANEGGNITAQNVFTMWSDLDNSFNFGPALYSTQQAGLLYSNASYGFSNYNAMVITLQKRYSQGLTLNANFTYSHALGTIGINQAYTEATLNDPNNYKVDYGPQYFDHKFVLNLLGSYQLPFGKGKPWLHNNSVLNKFVGGWVLSPILTLASGAPMSVYTGSFQEYGTNPCCSDNGFTAIPITPGQSYSNSPTFGINSTSQVAVNGNQGNGGSGGNIFANPTTVFNSFRPGLLGLDSNSGSAGILRGQVRWNVDMGLTKDTMFTERVGAQIFVQAFNVFNHMQFSDPFNSLQDPADFGALEGQFNALTLGGSGASANYTRIIQLGVRVHF